MTSRPRFVPLVCPECAGGLAGRAQDRVAFCARCSRAFLVSSAAPRPLTVLHVAEAVAGAGTPLALPFWCDGTSAVPAFLGARPLTLARAASGRLPRWRLAQGFGPQPPLGATLEEGALAAALRLIGMAPTAGDLRLLAVPALFTGTRYRVPGFAFELVRDDVLI